MLTLSTILHIYYIIEQFLQNSEITLFTCNFHFGGDGDGDGDYDEERLARAHIIQTQPSHVMYAHRDPEKDCPNMYTTWVVCTALYRPVQDLYRLSCNISSHTTASWVVVVSPSYSSSWY